MSPFQLPSEYSKDRKTQNEICTLRTRIQNTCARLRKDNAASEALDEVLQCRDLLSLYTWPQHREYVEAILSKYRTPRGRELFEQSDERYDVETVFGATETTDEYRAVIRTRQEKARVMGSRFRKLSYQYALHNVRVGFDESILANMPDDEF